MGLGKQARTEFEREERENKEKEAGALEQDRASVRWHNLEPPYEASRGLGSEHPSPNLQRW